MSGSFVGRGRSCVVMGEYTKEAWSLHHPSHSSCFCESWSIHDTCFDYRVSVYTTIRCLSRFYRFSSFFRSWSSHEDTLIMFAPFALCFFSKFWVTASHMQNRPWRSSVVNRALIAASCWCGSSCFGCKCRHRPPRLLHYCQKLVINTWGWVFILYQGGKAVTNRLKIWCIWDGHPAIL